METKSVIGTQVHSINYAVLRDKVLEMSMRGQSSFICFANVHMLMEAYDSDGYQKIINAADVVAPDGMPLVWLMRIKGLKKQQRVYGPTSMLHILEMAAREKIPVGFYGGKPGVLETLVSRMQERFKGLQIAYSFSPSFAEDLSEQDLSIKAIRNSNVRILFVGLGCPKQEIWMAGNYRKLNVVMLGVGAAFDFHAGIKPQAPVWMQQIGLEWLFRLLTEPRRLWRRYFYHNPRFILLALQDLFHDWHGKKYSNV